ncbi:hypothetical protein GCM10010922_01410 [Microbacterium sorbitolivorans]|uniref:Phage tail protein n=1 Tax=Microbacterium sorbitolivorans TaxID=1867410 RepID=A0A367Y9G1_9MICO|nr:hypothetical protein [Microbacterium sorbitolivorans]RCK61672.1 hypothetical protein DTO57_03330 [Microbacterium sorbitolivorans]GGF30184.1 hypothetical protein GCM10010922_01410 [Microbacterium sorbitolivorans]
MANALGPGTLTLGETGTLRQFAAHTTATSLVPSYSDGDVLDLLDGSTEREQDEETWALEGTIRQQLETDALEDWCLTNAGKEVTFTFKPVNSVTKTYTGTCRIRAVNIGGDVKTKNTSDFSFPIIGRPEIE